MSNLSKPIVDQEALAKFYADKANYERWLQRAGSWQRHSDKCMMIIFQLVPSKKERGCKLDCNCIVCDVESKYTKLGGGIKR